MWSLEIRCLDLRYAGLRIASPEARSRLEAAIAREGQQVPVLVVADQPNRWILVKGYGRVDALTRLGRDTVQALLLDVGETEALVLRYRLEHAGRLCALEEGWLLLVLLDRGLDQQQISVSLGKSVSWVSRRLALVRALPESVQQAVREARIGAHAAEKYLVPLARAKSEQCQQLVEGLRKFRPSVRELGRLYTAWKGATPEGRARIAEFPWLYLKVEERVKEDLSAIRILEAVAGSCGKARKEVRDGAVVRLPEQHRPELLGAWKEARLSFEALGRLLTQEGVDAG